MAQQGGSVYATNFGGPGVAFQANAVDVLGFITNISPDATPFWSMIEKGKANAALHEWLTDTLAALSATGSIEGDDVTGTVVTGRPRDTNYTQIFTRTPAVTGTNEVVGKYGGVKSEMAYQMEKAMRELKRNTEYAMFQNATTGNAGNASTGRLMKPIIDYVLTANKIDPASGANGLPVEQDLNTASQLAWSAGGDPDVIFCSPYHKRDFSAMTVPSGTARNVDATTGRVDRGIDVYRSDFELMKIIPSRHVKITSPGSSGLSDIFVLDSSTWRFDYLRNPQTIPLAKTGDHTRMLLLSEGCICGLAPAGNALIKQAASSYD